VRQIAGLHGETARPGGCLARTGVADRGSRGV